VFGKGKPSREVVATPPPSRGADRRWAGEREFRPAASINELVFSRDPSSSDYFLIAANGFTQFANRIARPTSCVQCWPKNGAVHGGVTSAIGANNQESYL